MKKVDAAWVQLNRAIDALRIVSVEAGRNKAGVAPMHIIEAEIELKLAITAWRDACLLDRSRNARG